MMQQSLESPFLVDGAARKDKPSDISEYNLYTEVTLSSPLPFSWISKGSAGKGDFESRPLLLSQIWTLASNPAEMHSYLCHSLKSLLAYFHYFSPKLAEPTSADQVSIYQTYSGLWRSFCEHPSRHFYLRNSKNFFVSFHQNGDHIKEILTAKNPKLLQTLNALIPKRADQVSGQDHHTRTPERAKEGKFQEHSHFAVLGFFPASTFIMKRLEDYGMAAE